MHHSVTFARGRSRDIETRHFTCPDARWRWLVRNRAYVLSMWSSPVRVRNV